MKEYDMADLYRQIGKVFRVNGADRVILLRSRRHADHAEMVLEIAVDGCIEKERLRNECKKMWPEIEVAVLDMNEDVHMDLLQEAIEDGILL